MSSLNTKLMGVLNVTPDSFSDGALYEERERAVARGLEMWHQGAHIIDVGGESTRPGATLVGPETEQGRVLPVVSALAAAGVRVSIDTISSKTAREAVRAGAVIVNDVSGGKHDAQMYETVAALQHEALKQEALQQEALQKWTPQHEAQKAGITYIIGHWRGVPDPNHAKSNYESAAREVFAELKDLADQAVASGVKPDSIMLDPGLGFDKDGEQSWQILRNIADLRALGYGVCIGVSRKRMIGEIVTRTRVQHENPTVDTGEKNAAAVTGEKNAAGSTDFRDRDLATAVTTALLAEAGVEMVRVHDVLGSAQALEVLKSMRGTTSTASPAGTATVQDAATHGATANVADAHTTPSSSTAAPVNDKISLKGLEIFAHHGVFDFERRDGQRFIVDVEVHTDMTPAIKGDDLQATVNYAELAENIIESVRRDPVDLIETLAERVAQVALAFAAAKEVTVTVHKPDAPIEATFDDVAVTITRKKLARGDAS